jgi:hypothetical protein
MLTKEERDLLVTIQDRLLALYVRRDNAKKAQDLAQLRTLDREIAITETQRAELRRWKMAGAA